MSSRGEPQAGTGYRGGLTIESGSADGPKTGSSALSSLPLYGTANFRTGGATVAGRHWLPTRGRGNSRRPPLAVGSGAGHTAP